MTQTVPPNYDPGGCCLSCLFSPFSLFSITLISCSSSQPGKLLHGDIQIPSAWDVIPLDIYIDGSFTSFRFTQMSVQTKVFLGLLYPCFSFSTDLIATQYIISLLTLFIIFLFKLNKTPKDGNVLFPWCLVLTHTPGT